MATSAICTRGLTKRFGDRIAFEDLTFDVAPGEIFGFLGPNGAGKTTTVRVLGTLLAATEGTAEVAGIPVGVGAGSELRRRISVMPETPGLYVKLSVRENLEYFTGLYEIPRRDAGSRIAGVLDAVGMTDRCEDLAGSLSKGLKQRAALARALLCNPEVLFLDEPTSGLDPAAAVEVRDLIAGLRARGATVFLTTHRLEEAERVCDRVAILNTRLRAIGRPADLRRRLFGNSIDVRLAAALPDPGAVFSSVPGVQGWTAEGSCYRIGVADARAVAPELTRALVRAGADVLRVAEVEHSLEDAYLEIVGEQEGRA